MLKGVSGLLVLAGGWSWSSGLRLLPSRTAGRLESPLEVMTAQQLTENVKVWTRRKTSHGKDHRCNLISLLTPRLPPSLWSTFPEWRTIWIYIRPALTRWTAMHQELDRLTCYCGRQSITHFTPPLPSSLFLSACVSARAGGELWDRTVQLQIRVGSIYTLSVKRHHLSPNEQMCLSARYHRHLRRITLRQSSGQLQSETDNKQMRKWECALNCTDRAMHERDRALQG